MKFRTFRHPAILAGLALIAPLALPTGARADLIVMASEDGGRSTTILNVQGSPSSPNGFTFGTPPNINTNLTADFVANNTTLNETQVPSFSEVLSSALSLTNSGTATHTLTLTIQATGFTAPTAPPGALLTSDVSGTVRGNGNVGNADNLLTFQSRADNAASTALQTPAINQAGSFSTPTASTSIATGLTAPYTVFQFYTITLNAGANIQLSGRTDLLPRPAPEPATLAMAATVLPVLGYGAYRRRRRIVG